MVVYMHPPCVYMHLSQDQVIGVTMTHAWPVLLSVTFMEIHPTRSVSLAASPCSLEGCSALCTHDGPVNPTGIGQRHYRRNYSRPGHSSVRSLHPAMVYTITER